MTSIKLAAVSALALGLAAGGALAQATGSTMGTGTDADAATGTDMGATGAGAATDMATTGTDGMAGGSMMGTYDADASGTVSEEEFGAGMASGGTFQSLDVDSDGMVSQDEYLAARPDDQQIFEEMDAAGAGMLSEEDYGAATFRQFDADESGDLDETEFGQYETDMGGMGGATDAAAGTAPTEGGVQPGGARDTTEVGVGGTVPDPNMNMDVEDVESEPVEGAVGEEGAADTDG